MGCMGFGDPANGQHSWTVGESQTREIIRYALEKGINFFDTAIGYQNGTSERYVGQALRDFARREDVVVATLVGVMAQNTPSAADRQQVWTRSNDILK